MASLTWLRNRIRPKVSELFGPGFTTLGLNSEGSSNRGLLLFILEHKLSLGWAGGIYNALEKKCEKRVKILNENEETNKIKEKWKVKRYRDRTKRDRTSNDPT
jgi:hypothetical protein